MPHPQLLDHRPHRSRQVDAGRSAAGGDRHDHRARAHGAAARQHGPRARARHHHQGQRRAHALRAARRQDVPAEPDRHARARRLRLRGVAQPGGLRRARCWSSTRRRASRRRPSPTSTWRSTTTSRSLPVINKIDLPERRSRARARPRSRRSSASTRSEAVLASAKQGIGIDEVLEGIVRIVPPPAGDADGAAAGADLRQLVRSLPRGRGAWCACSTAASAPASASC